MSIVVVARWQVATGAIDDVLPLVDELQRRSLEEPGGEGYEVLRPTEDDAAIVLIERYRDAAAIDEHRQSAHYQELVIGKILPKLTSRRVEVLTARGGR